MYDSYSNQFAHGGPVHSGGLRDMAEMLRHEGEDQDTILAHINPQEAKLLAENFGYDINPETGLPQFGFKLRHLFKGAGKIFKGALPILGGALGTMAGIPMGGMLGGALAGAIGGKKNRGKHALTGAALGGLTGAALPHLQEAFGFGGGNSGYNAGDEGGYRWQNPNNLQQAQNGLPNHKGNTLGDFLGTSGNAVNSYFKNMDMNKLLDMAALGTTVIGTLGRRPVSQNKLMQQMAGPPDSYINKLPSFPQKPLNRRWNPETQELEQFAQGGYFRSGGYLDGDTDGMADEINAKLCDGEFVMRADAVSALGNGNSNAGGKIMQRFQDNILKHKGIGKKQIPAKDLSYYLRGGK